MKSSKDVYKLIKDKKKKQGNNLKYDGYKTSFIDKKKDIEIKNLIVVNPCFKEPLIQRKIDAKLIKLLELLGKIYETDDDPNGVILSLTEVEKFKSEIVRKYAHDLTKAQKEKLAKKMHIVELELKKRMISYQQIYKKVEEQEVEKNTRHR